LLELIAATHEAKQRPCQLKCTHILTPEVSRMRAFLPAVLTLVVLPLTTIAAVDQGAAPAAVRLTKTAVVPEAKTDQRDLMAPEAGKQFLWVSATLAGGQKPIDLTKVALTNGSDSYPLIGVDSVWGGDPNQFSMIAPVKLKSGKVRDPLEESRSTGDVAFAFTPGKAATMTVLRPPQSVCLLFLVPASVHTGQVKGLSATPMALPAAASGKP
jgi:hypothetical protein